MGSSVPPCPFSKTEKSALIWRKFLSKCLDSMKPPLPWKISTCLLPMSNKKNWGFGGECGEAPFVGRRGGGGGAGGGGGGGGGWGLRKSCETFHVWRSYGNCWIHLGEYLVNARLDFVTKLQKYTSFAYSWSTSAVRSAKNQTLLWLAIIPKCGNSSPARLNMVKQGCIYSKLKIAASQTVNG